MVFKNVFNELHHILGTFIVMFIRILNLVLIDVSFCIASMLYVFVSITKAHTIFLKRKNKLYPDKQPRQLQHLSDTWWTC